MEFRHKSYYDEISNFVYEPLEKIITFEMPFNWETKNISHLQVVHEEIFFPKNFTEMISPGYKAQINGIDVFKSNLQIDDYSDEESNYRSSQSSHDDISYNSMNSRRNDDEMDRISREMKHLQEKFERLSRSRR